MTKPSTPSTLSIRLFKYRLTFYSHFVGFYYEPNGTDKSDQLLLGRQIWSIKYPFVKKIIK